MSATYLGRNHNLYIMRCGSCGHTHQALYMGLMQGAFRTCPTCRKLFVDDAAIQQVIDAGHVAPARGHARYAGKRGLQHRIHCGHCGTEWLVSDQTIVAGGMRYCGKPGCLRPLITRRLLDAIAAGAPSTPEWVSVA